MSLTCVTNNKPLRYRAYIDGLRAVAVLAVLCFHANLGLPGGFVGVDVFFVISGYLITGLILKDLDNHQFRFLVFWERRIRRLLPALIVVAFASLTAGWFLFLPQDFQELGRSVVAQVALLSNVHFYHDSGYFAQATEIKPLLHTWSLAVEEQFYLLFPFVLFASRSLSRRARLVALVIVGTLSFSLSLWWSYHDVAANFYLLPTRAWELLLGACLAAVPGRHPCSRWVAESLSWGGLLGIATAALFYSRETRFPGAAAILPCGGTALVIFANGRILTTAGQILAARPVVFFGLISYSLYLWHWPMLAFAKYGRHTPFPRRYGLLLLLTSIILGTLSWKFVETPFRRRVICGRKRQILILAGTATAVLLLAGFTIDKLEGVPSRIPTDALQFVSETNNNYQSFSEINLSLKQAIDGELTELGLGDTSRPIDLLVWGDSHAMAVLPVLDSLCKGHVIRGVAATHLATFPSIEYESRHEQSLKKDSLPFNRAILAYIRTKQVPHVLIIARWDYYLDHDEGAAGVRHALLATAQALQDTGVRIWIMRQVPMYHWNVPRALAFAVMNGHDLEALGLPLAEHRREVQRHDVMFKGTSINPHLLVLDFA